MVGLLLSLEQHPLPLTVCLCAKCERLLKLIPNVPAQSDANNSRFSYPLWFSAQPLFGGPLKIVNGKVSGRRCGRDGQGRRRVEQRGVKKKTAEAGHLTPVFQAVRLCQVFAFISCDPRNASSSIPIKSQPTANAVHALEVAADMYWKMRFNRIILQLL